MTKKTLIRWGENEEVEASFPHVGRRAWRWTLEIAFSGLWLHEEVKFLEGLHKTDPGPSDWMLAARYFGIFFSREFLFEASHDYYDGPHCMWAIGWLRISWSWNWCKKCMPDREG